MPHDLYARAIRSLGLAAVIGLSACGPGPDMPTACANRIADMFDVPRDKLVLYDPEEKGDGKWTLGGAVDLKFWSDGTRSFECRFDRAGHLAVEILPSDQE